MPEGTFNLPSRLKGEGPQPHSGPLRPPSAKGKAGRSGPQRQRVRQQPQPGDQLGVEMGARARVGGRSWARTERPSGGPSMQELRRPRQDVLMVRQQRAQGHTENREATGQGAAQRGQGQRHRSDGDRDPEVTGVENPRATPGNTGSGEGLRLGTPSGSALPPAVALGRTGNLSDPPFPQLLSDEACEDQTRRGTGCVVRLMPGGQGPWGCLPTLSPLAPLRRK